MINLFTTQDGSHSLFSSQFDSHYHSTYGAINESVHIFIKTGLNYCQLKSVNIFEVGFGTGLNAFLAFLTGINRDLKIKYTSIEKFPIDQKIASALNYPNLLAKDHQHIFNKLHECNWDEEIKISENFIFKKIHYDFNDYVFTDSFDVIFFDAFAPEKQPELWSSENFKKIYSSLNNLGLLTTYSSKGMVKNNLRDAGFILRRLKGPEGKRHILRAEKIIQ